MKASITELSPNSLTVELSGNHPADRTKYRVQLVVGRVHPRVYEHKSDPFGNWYFKELSDVDKERAVVTEALLTVCQQLVKY